VTQEGALPKTYSILECAGDIRSGGPMTWIKTIPLSQADERLRHAIES
jgi:hypothetical protein